MNTDRKVPRFSKATKKNIHLYAALTGVILIALFLTGAFIIQNNTPGFKPPPFDRSAQTGEPNPPIDLGYLSMSVEQGFDIKLCGRLFIKNNSVDIYFTNPKSNDVWLMTELQDENGKTLAESGVIKQGEYVTSINLLMNVTADSTNVKIVIIAYSPDTYISRGSVSMKTVLFRQ